MSDFKIAIRISLSFFVLATLILGAYYFTMSDTVAQFGYAYTGIAVFIGMIYLIVLGFRIIQKKIGTRTGLKCASVIFLNIPVAAVYYYLVLILMTTARITFENATGKDITAVSIGGCASENLRDLKNGESQTVWVHIKSDCSLVLLYTIDRQPVLETPFGYLTHNDGMIATYKIGSNTSK